MWASAEVGEKLVLRTDSGCFVSPWMVQVGDGYSWRIRFLAGSVSRA